MRLNLTDLVDCLLMIQPGLKRLESIFNHFYWFRESGGHLVVTTCEGQLCGGIAVEDAMDYRDSFIK